MIRRVYLKDLECYINASGEMKRHPLMCPERYFDLDELPTDEIKNEMEEFIKFRGQQLAPLSIRSELHPFRQLCGFLSDSCPDIRTFADVDINKIIKKAKGWLLTNNKSISQIRNRTATGKKEVIDAELVTYLRKAYAFKNPDDKKFDYDADRWYLTDIPIALKSNPTKAVNSITFEKIAQDQMRSEIKKIIYIHLSQKALGTVAAEITAINRFTAFLKDRFPDIKEIREVDREVMESYLIHTNTEASGRKSYSKELCHLKSVFMTAANVFEDKDLSVLFYADDIAKTPKYIYKVYSDAELKRLNAAIVELDEQIARALILHQMLGTRISEILMLRQDSVRLADSGKLLIKIWQVKTRKSYEKVINEDIKNLFDRACMYTNEKHGKCEYVFVNNEDPTKPMQYGRIQYQLMAMITKNDLKDDNGERFRVGTHIFRHCYGKKLTEMNVDDIVIAKLLGHTNTGSVKYYRKIGNEMLSKETKNMRDAMDQQLEYITREW